MRPFSSIVLGLLVVAGANAQTVADVRVLSEAPNSIVIELTPRYANTTVTGTDGVKYTRFEFHGAAFDPGEPGSPLVPFRPVLLQLPSRRYSVEVLAQDYDDLTGIKAATRPSLQSIKGFGFSPAYSSPKPKYLVSERAPRQSVEMKDVGVSRGVLLGTLRIYPVQFSLSRNEVRVFRRIVVRVNFTGGRPTAQVASAFLKSQFPSQLLKTEQAGSQILVSDSPLAQGDWYRMEVAETGIYRIDQSFLSKAGISSSAIGNVNSIRIFGNDGLELPEDLNAARPNGNVEIPRLVVDKNGNGVLDADDFILFYGKSPRGWKYSPTEKTFHHYLNHYTEANVYFLTFGGTGRGKNMDSVSSTNTSGGYKPSDIQGKLFVEDEKVNFVKSGREWVGEAFDISQTFNAFTNNIPAVVSTKPVTYRFAFYSRSASVDTFTVLENGQSLGVPMMMYPVDLSSFEQERAYQAPAYTFTRTGALPNDRSLLRIQFGAASQAAQGWLDWFEILYNRRFEADNDLLLFPSPDTSAVINYEISKFSSREIYVFDVTQHNAVKQVTSLAFDAADASIVRFQLSQTSGSVRELIAMGPKGYKTALNVKRMSNSNLHGNIAGADFIILTPPDFSSEAQRLKAHREQIDQMTVSVVNLDQVFNEFSSGNPDPIAIRDFLKYAQTTWKIAPQYVLLFGAGNYDYRNNRNTNATNWVPPYETLESNIQILTLASDDYYVFLDPSADRISMAIGRLPIRSLTDAQTVVNKIISYESNASFDSWRNKITFVADDGLTSTGDDRDTHTSQAEELAQGHTPDSFTKDKIYIVQYPTVNTSTGRRKPTANEAIDEAINAGTAILNWTGHGNTLQWAHENVFSIDQDFPLLNNKGKLFFLVAATCDYARYDDPPPSDVSAGEQLLLMADRGAIGEVTPDRIVYSGDNAILNEALYDNLLKMDSQGKPVRLGDAMWQTKQVLNSTNDQKHHLLADPTMRLAVPRGVVSIDSVNGQAATSLVAAGALSKVRVTGSVKKSDGSTPTSLRGQALLEVYDSKRTVLVPIWGDYSFVMNGSLIYRGQVSVRNGQVQGTFPIPKDVSYGNDRSRIALYASNDSTDAVGYTENFSITGTSVAAVDTTGPSMKIYFNDQTSHTGGVISPDATMIVDLADSSGINTSTAGIGHKLEATLDGSQKTFDLTGFYRGNLDTYQSGQIRYQFTALPEGRHTIDVKAWDIYNNSSSAEAFFEVRATSQLSLYNVFNVPNPFARSTTFTFQRTSNDPVDVEIKVYTVAGRLIQTLEASSVVDRFVQMPWDGRDRDGSELANGVYLYRVIAKSLDRTSTSEVIGKLAVLR
ncbi:MAG: type IX secretion system sortase PorU [Ignavibacteriales bacterium]|nr:type IX secretion system sortase PorU [Ignavibacteriales bacterium]